MGRRFFLCLLVVGPSSAFLQVQGLPIRRQLALETSKDSPFWFADAKSEDGPKGGAKKSSGWLFGGEARGETAEEPALVEFRAGAREVADLVESSMTEVAAELETLKTEILRVEDEIVKAKDRADAAREARSVALKELAEIRGPARFEALRAARSEADAAVASDCKKHATTVAKAAEVRETIIRDRPAQVAKARDEAEVRLAVVLAELAEARSALAEAQRRSAAQIADCRAEAGTRVQKAEALSESVTVDDFSPVRPEVAVVVSALAALLVADAVGLDDFDLFAALVGAVLTVANLPTDQPTDGPSSTTRTQ